MKIKAIIFDMDGVLIDARDWHYDALNQALALFGYEIGRHEHLTQYDGLPTRAKLARLTEEKGLPSHLHSFINSMKQQYTMSLINNLCRPHFNHEYALSRLRAEGYRLVLASNSMRSTIDAMMAKALLTHHFEFMLSNQDVAIGKPDPEIYHKVIAGLGLSPQECLVVEDNENGIRAAQAAGTHLLVVGGVEEVNYFSIMKRVEEINSCESSSKASVVTQ